MSVPASRRYGEEWYTCERCGFDYPRRFVVVHNGRVLCHGIRTSNCVDQPGRDSFDIKSGYEASPDPLPSVTEKI